MADILQTYDMPSGCLTCIETAKTIDAEFACPLARALINYATLSADVEKIDEIPRNQELLGALAGAAFSVKVSNLQQPNAVLVDADQYANGCPGAFIEKHVKDDVMTSTVTLPWCYYPKFGTLYTGDPKTPPSKRKESDIVPTTDCDYSHDKDAAGMTRCISQTTNIPVAITTFESGATYEVQSSYFGNTSRDQQWLSMSANGRADSLDRLVDTIYKAADYVAKKSSI